MEIKSFDVLIIGAGPGGVEAAIRLGKSNLKIAIVSNTKIGGRATWGSLIPSKVWLSSASKMDELKSAGKFGLNVNLSQSISAFDHDALRSRVKKNSLVTAERYIHLLKESNCEILTGSAMLVSDQTIQITPKEGEAYDVNAEKIIISTGSGPKFFPEIKPDKVKIIAPKLAPSLNEIPKSMVVAGGGVTGSEYAYAFAALGTEVTIIQNADQLLPRVDTEVSESFAQFLKAEHNITIETGSPVKSMQRDGEQVITTLDNGKSISSDYGFIAIGRVPDLSFLGDSGINFDQNQDKTIAVDQYCRTSQSHIYAIGDVSGTPMMANRAFMQARVAVDHILYGDTSTTFMGHYIEAAYTNPPVAQIGTMDESEDAYFVTKKYADLVKGNILEKQNGLLKFKVDNKSGLILAAAGFGSNMADIMAAIQLAMNNNVKFEDVAKMPVGHPSMAELLSY